MSLYLTITLSDKNRNILKAIQLAELKIEIYIIIKGPISQGGGYQNSNHGSGQKYRDQSADGKSEIKGYQNG